MGMKLAGLLLVLLVGTASAQGYNGPPPQVGIGLERVPPRVAFRQMIVERFDANHDGRLEPRERRHAAKALRKLAKRMARGERRQARQPRW